MVADKEFYYGTYHGKLPETDVEGCLVRAEYILHSLTMNRLQDEAEEDENPHPIGPAEAGRVEQGERGEEGAAEGN